MHVGVVSQCYDPEGGSAAVAGAICRSLAALGHGVDVLTGFPNYPTGKIFPGYRMRPYLYEHRAGVHVHRVPLIPSHNRSAMRRAATYLSFAASASAKVRILRSVDAWLVISSQATAAIPAMVARSLFGRPYVLHVHDLWPHTVVESGFVRPGPLLQAMTRSLHTFCDAAYQRAAAVAVTSPGMARVVQARGVSEDKVTVVPNWVDETVFYPVARDEQLARQWGLTGFVVMYAGSLGELQGLETAIEAMALLPDLPEVRLVFAGTGVAQQRLRQAAQGMDRVMFLGQQPVERMAALLALSHVQLVSLKDLPLFRSTLPSKTQAVLACGRPMIGAVAGDAAGLIERSGAGFAVPPGNAAALAAAIRRCYQMDAATREAMGRAGHQYYWERLSARVGSAALAALMRHAVGRTQHG